LVAQAAARRAPIQARAAARRASIQARAAARRAPIQAQAAHRGSVQARLGPAQAQPAPPRAWRGGAPAPAARRAAARAEPVFSALRSCARPKLRACLQPLADEAEVAMQLLALVAGRPRPSREPSPTKQRSRSC